MWDSDAPRIRQRCIYKGCHQFYSGFSYNYKTNDERDKTESKCRYKTWDNDSGPHHQDIAKSHGQSSYEARGKDQGSW